MQKLTADTGQIQYTIHQFWNTTQAICCTMYRIQLDKSCWNGPVHSFKNCQSQTQLAVQKTMLMKSMEEARLCILIPLKTLFGQCDIFTAMGDCK